MYPMSNPRKGQYVQCVKCLKMIEGSKALADLDAQAGTFYHPECVPEGVTWVSEITSGPDSQGRYTYVKSWYVEHPCYCLTCGKDPSMNCECYGKNKIRSQVFFGVPPVRTSVREMV